MEEIHGTSNQAAQEAIVKTEVYLLHFLPLWLTPDQVAILPISEKFNDYAQKGPCSKPSAESP